MSNAIQYYATEKDKSKGQREWREDGHMMEIRDELGERHIKEGSTAIMVI